MALGGQEEGFLACFVRSPRHMVSACLALGTRASIVQVSDSENRVSARVCSCSAVPGVMVFCSMGSKRFALES